MLLIYNGRYSYSILDTIENIHGRYRYLFVLSFTQLLLVTVTSLLLPLLVTILKFINFIKELSLYILTKAQLHYNKPIECL